MSPTNPLKTSLAAYDHLLTAQVLRAQRDLAVAMSGEINLSEAFSQVLKTITKITPMDCGGIYLLEESEKALNLEAYHGLSMEFVNAVRTFDQSSPNFALVMHGEAVYIPYDEIPFPSAATRSYEGLKAIAIIPVAYRGKIIACLNVASHTTTEIKPLIRNILESISIQIATAVARLRTEVLLHESETARAAIEARFRALVDQSTDGIIICDSSGLIIEWNHAQEEITAISSKAALGRSLAAMGFLLVEGGYQIAQATYRLFSEWMYETTDKTSSWFGKTQEISILRSDGQRKELEILTFSFVSGDQTMICLQCRDLTGRREMERRLRENEQLFRTLVETTRAGIFILRDGKIVFANPAISEISGFSVAEIRDGNALDALVPNWKSQLNYLWGSPADQAKLDDSQEVPEITPDTLIQVNHVLEFKTRAGEQRWAEISWGGFRLFDANFIVGIAIDITEQKLFANQLAERNKELTLLNVISHQVGNLQSSDQMMMIVRDLLESQMGLQNGEIYLLDSSKGTQRCVARWGLPDGPEADLGTLYQQKWIVREGRLVLIDDEQLSEPPPFKSMIRIPLLSSGEIQGYLDLYTQDACTECTEQISFLENLGRTVGMFIQNTRLFAQVTHARERFQAFSRRLVRIQEAERRHIARELHDEAGQSLTYILMGLDLLNRELTSPEDARKRVETLKKVANDVMEDLHRLATDLRPIGLDRLGLYVMLQQMVEIFRVEFKMQVDFSYNGPVEKRLPLTMETALYRIVQEAFTNIARHSRARIVSLLFGMDTESVKLIIKDNGVGFDPEKNMGEGKLGLLGIRERVEMLGGLFVIESTPGKGTILLVEVPLDQKNLDR